jgi:hypothetical protein
MQLIREGNCNIEKKKRGKIKCTEKGTRDRGLSILLNFGGFSILFFAAKQNKITENIVDHHLCDIYTHIIFY